MLNTFVLILFHIYVQTFANHDEITSLPPGLQVNFKHYSGYLQVNKTKFLHYWFVESQNDPQADPLVFWYNGGPGCSSLIGLLNEHGPYFPKNGSRILTRNPNSWNTNANVVYIESPIGVGYSYGTRGDDYKARDEYTAQLNYDSLKQFFHLYPQFRYHQVFITGESYGGVYVPTLAAKILQGMEDFKINLQGIAIGNGWVHGTSFLETYPLFEFTHGLIGHDEYTDLVGNSSVTGQVSYFSSQERREKLRNVAISSTRQGIVF